MRLTASFSLFAAALTLTACGEGSALDEQVQTSLRSSLVASCTATAQGQIPQGVQVDLDTVCN